MTVSIRGTRVINSASGLDQVGDLHIEAGKIVAIDAAPAGFNAQKTLDGAGLVAMPGLVDLSVVLYELGYGRKSNVESGACAATIGGTTSLCYPPYTRPVLGTPAVTELVFDCVHEAGNAKVCPVGVLTHDPSDEQLLELVALRDTGYVAFTNGLCGFTSNHILRRALEYATTFDLTVIFISRDTSLAEGGLAYEGSTASFLGLAEIPETAEAMVLARDLLLVEQNGVRAHFNQLTSTRGIEPVAQTQVCGLPMTCDVELYQSILTDEALVSLPSLYHVQLPLYTRADRETPREVVKSGVVQAIASHHQPHEAGAKNAPFTATESGISGAELLLPLATMLIQDGLLDLSTLLARSSHGLAQALRLFAGRLAAGQAADLVLFDPQGLALVGRSWYSKGQNSPLIGHCLLGRMRYTLMDGRPIHEG